jgi:hypothetical protein
MARRYSVLAMMLAAAGLVLVSVLGAYAQLSGSQQTCLNNLKKDGAAVAKITSRPSATAAGRSACSPSTPAAST